MSTSIYNIGSWQTSTLFNGGDIIRENNKYYYATIAHTSGGSFIYDLMLGLWNGYATDVNGDEKPYFFWKPSFASTVNIAPRVKIVSFGDTYEQRMADGINNIMLEFDLAFEQRDIHEYSAIMHFLITRAATESFLFVAPQPFNTKKRFLCRSWDGTPESYNNFTIKTKFEETTT